MPQIDRSHEPGDNHQAADAPRMSRNAEVQRFIVQTDKDGRTNDLHMVQDGLVAAIPLSAIKSGKVHIGNRWVEGDNRPETLDHDRSRLQKVAKGGGRNETWGRAIARIDNGYRYEDGSYYISNQQVVLDIKNGRHRVEALIREEWEWVPFLVSKEDARIIKSAVRDARIFHTGDLVMGKDTIGSRSHEHELPVLDPAPLLAERPEMRLVSEKTMGNAQRLRRLYRMPIIGALAHKWDASNRLR